MTKLHRVLTSLVLIGLFCGCSDGPFHHVIDSKSLVIYAAKKRERADLGKYEYHIRDNSTNGWRLTSDQEFQVGDTLRIVKVEPDAIDP